MLKKVFIIAIIFILLILSKSLYVFSQDNTNDQVKETITETEKAKDKKMICFDEDYEPPEEELKRLPVIFDIGGSISLTSRIMFKTFKAAADGGIEPVPDDQWYGDVTGKFWGRMSIEEDRFFHLGVRALLKMERNDYGYRYNSLVPLFNVDELFFNWQYIIGKIVLGRTNYNLKSALIFNGPLDGLELDINIPYLNFKTFLGFTGFLGLFNPWFNPYSITPTDRLYEEETNLLFSKMILKFNSNQSRRIFFATDFDINFFGQHINPYFLMQYDISSIFYNLNTDLDVHTFHLGLNMEGRIVRELYYKTHISGLFGMSPTSTSGVKKAILSCAFESSLRYSIPVAGYSTFVGGYAFGLGNSESIGEWSDYPDDSEEGFWSEKYDGISNNKFYYYGKFDGGYVLNPILSNIHSISFKYMVSPYNKGATHITLYIAYYQTFKFFPTGPISDDECDLNSYLVGCEVDAGLMANLGAVFNFGFDTGLFVPLTAYSDRSLRFKLGATMGFTF